MKQKLCNINFESQYAFVKNKQIPIVDYLKNIELYKNEPLTCDKGHDLILANGKINRPHFRHRHNEDVDANHPMTRWHSEWQGNFEVTEREYKRKNSDQVKDRRADIVLDKYNKIVEIQHSLIEEEEVNNRKHDYELHKMETVWIIHGNDAINVKKLESSNRVYLEFVSDHWKYRSFLSYKYIYIDINDQIYKINPNMVKSYMIDVESAKEKNEFISSLKNGIDLWSNIEPDQCKLFIKQQGAGNGKTWGIINMIESDEVSHYKNLIYVTKQHSAKYVIANELKMQYKNGDLKYITNLKGEDEPVKKKYIISYHNKKTDCDVQMIIATIDSFMYSIGNRNHLEFDTFEGIINSIIDEYITSDKSGKITFAGIDPRLNKETLLVIDEAQDLKENYAKAIIQIMRNKYIDSYIVGDKLQSISNELNSFTYLSNNEFSFINRTLLEPENICRRFTDEKLVDFVNTIIPFKNHNLPSVKPYKILNSQENEPIIFFEGMPIYDSIKHDEKENIMNNEIEKIMEYFKREVERNNRSPKDFLIVTPFTSNNPLVDALQLAIDMYWKEKLGINLDKYTRYSIFHKSEEGTSIDLSESEESTRIVSIHSSKGDGRPVVFLIGISESAIKRFSLKKDTLIYDSLFHVSLTRMKEKLYIRYENNNDNISNKINKYIHYNNLEESVVKPNFRIYNSIKYKDIIGKSNNLYFQKWNDIIESTEIEKLPESEDDKRIIDMGNHTIRYASLLISILVEIVNKEYNDNVKKQIIALWHSIINSDIIQVPTWKDYNTLITNKMICLIKISNKGKDYLEYYNILLELMKNIQNKLRKFINNKNILYFCPLESVIFNHMIGIKKNGIYIDTHISDIYHIIDIYKNSFSEESQGHDMCLCKQHFTKKIIKNESNIDTLKSYIHIHYDKVKDIKNTMNTFYSKYLKISWLYQHLIMYNGNNNDYKLYKQFTLVGYNDTTVIIGYVKPQFNQLNYNEILMDSIFDTFLISNIKKYKHKEDDNEDDDIANNYKRFNGKNIVTCLFTLDRDQPYYIEWDISKINSLNIKNIIYEYMLEKYKSDNNSIQYFYKYHRNNCPDNKRSPSDFIQYLIEKYHEIKTNNKFPSYIEEFLIKIKNQLEDCNKRKEKEKLLSEYDNPDIFMDKLNSKLDTSIKSYLNINEDESDEDD